MSMRVSTLVTHLRAGEALTLIEFLDQVRDLLMATYGNEVAALLREASQRDQCEVGDSVCDSIGDWLAEDEMPF